MPAKPSRACRFGTCPHPAVSRGRCAQHAKPDEQQRHRFGQAIYNDRRWRGKHGLRRRVLDAQPLCVLCLVERGRVTIATCVDHVVSHHGDEALAFDIMNLRSLCSSCHGQVTAAATVRV
jgi:5-methylcytosine-specific restriction protein A